MKVAIIHYWLVGMRGGEKVIESLCKIFPNADIFTHVYDPSNISDTINKHTVKTTFINKLPGAKKHYQKYLPLMPMALESLDLIDYDLIISSESGPAKGIISRPDALHICYCHSPMRYIWDHYHIYRKQAGFLTRLFMPVLAHRLRKWDVGSASRVDVIIANSNYVAKRIKKYWRRESTVIHPPVAVADFTPAPDTKIGNFYLWVGELVSYKRPDLMIEAFNQNGKPLIIIGGPDKAVSQLKKTSHSNIKFLGKTDFSTLKQHMATCKALIFPGEEDFGIVPVEVMASGRPVIAYSRGGVQDTVQNNKTGLFFYEPSSDSLNNAINLFEKKLLKNLSTSQIISHAATFSEAHFICMLKNELSNHGIKVQENT